ncbi:MAG: MBL fold metallo-hydrolase [Candidatus Dormibacteria bacterium]
MTPPRNKSASAVAREIVKDVYCLRPRGRTQTNVYLVRSGSSWALIDSGWARDGPRIKKAAESVFGGDARPASILLTHYHPDHAGSALQLARIWNCAIFVGHDELPLASGDFSAIAAGAGPLDRWVILPLMRAIGRRRREAMLARSSLQDVARAIEPNGEVPGLSGWACIPTPGHTRGHVSFLRTIDHVLITGDAVVTMQLNTVPGLLLQKPGLSGPPWYTTWSWRAATQSIARLALLEPTVLAGGHGTPITGPETAGAFRIFADHLSAGRER